MEKGTKYDDGKPRMGLLDPYVMTEVAKVLTKGAAKYGDPYNYKKGLAWSRCYDAAQRHLNAFWAGEDLDPEWNLPHLAHAMCSIMFLMWMSEFKPEFDDRWTTEQESLPKGR